MGGARLSQQRKDSFVTPHSPFECRHKFEQDVPPALSVAYSISLLFAVFEGSEPCVRGSRESRIKVHLFRTGIGTSVARVWVTSQDLWPVSLAFGEHLKKRAIDSTPGHPCSVQSLATDRTDQTSHHTLR